VSRAYLLSPKSLSPSLYKGIAGSVASAACIVISAGIPGYVR